MKLIFPSPEFDEAVAAVCHGTVSDDRMRALNELLRNHAAARDEYILRLELHSRLASDSDLFASAAGETGTEKNIRRAHQRALPPASPRRTSRQTFARRIALLACLVLVGVVAWRMWPRPSAPGVVATSKAVAMLGETANARWSVSGESPRPGTPLEPGRLNLDAGLAQLVFYSGARLVVEGPAEIELISASHIACRRGKVTAEVPPQARGFCIDTPQGKVTDLGTVFGMEVNDRHAEVHVFKGEVTVQATAARTHNNLREGAGAVIEALNETPRDILADPKAFASLFQLQAMSSAAEALRFRHWRVASERQNTDPSLAVRFDFDAGEPEPSLWQLANVSAHAGPARDATIVGCHWGQGRWPGKRALEFQSVNDRVRLNVPGESNALTIATWVRVHGLDRKLNSLFMCDGFAPGSVHWLIRNDGVLGITIVGEGRKNYQIATSPPVVTLDRFGMWLHLAVVVDGDAERVIHYVNGQPVGEKALRIKPPYRIGAAELGNWHARGFPENDPFMIRNFSGAMDEFCLFLRPLDAGEIRALYAEGRPDAELVVSRE